MTFVNPHIRAAMADKETQDAKIMAKVNAAHREAFKEKFPGQCEHIVRLTAERLQAVLSKRGECDINDPKTWPASAREIADLAIAMSYVYEILRDLQTEQE